MGAVFKKAVDLGTVPIKGGVNTIKAASKGEWGKAAMAATKAHGEKWIAHSKTYGVGQAPIEQGPAPTATLLPEDDPNRYKQRSIYT